MKRPPTNEGELTAKREMMPLKLRPSRRKRELQNYLLAPLVMWEDLLPPALPPRPTDLFLRQSRRKIMVRSANCLNWVPTSTPRLQGALADLACMSLNEGLLAGWPGESSLWAPYHALHLLGAMRAVEFVTPLMALARRADD